MVSSRSLYFVAVIPPVGVKDEILELKLEIKERYNAAHALKLPAHITLLPPFWLEEREEEELINVLRETAQKQEPFPVELKDFGHFGNRVIYVDVANPYPLKNLYHSFLTTSGKYLKEPVANSIHPHITLATRDLKGKDFGEAWKEFKTRFYSNSFTAKAVVLLKHDGKIWNIYREFALGEPADL